MPVRDILYEAMAKLLPTLCAQIGEGETLSVNDVFEKSGFDDNDFDIGYDANGLYDLLTFSMGLSKLWSEYKKTHPNAPIDRVNAVIPVYMRNMWGLEKVNANGKLL